MLLETPFHARTAPLMRAQTWRRWAGYQVATAYDPHPDREYAAIRNAAALFDVSPLYKYRDHRDATRRGCSTAWSRATSRSCAVGQVLYTPWCDAHGKVHRRRHDQPARRGHVPPDQRRAELALAAA